MIMQKLASGDFQDGNQMDEMGGERQGTNFGVEEMDPKVIATYKKLGVVMKTYRSGKLPKAFKIIPQVANWEELLFLTMPHMWSPHATYEATKIFASNLNGKLVQRFYSLVLLNNVRDNIGKYKKLNCHLYRAVKKAIFKTSAFFRGFLLPLAEDATAREAVIIGSILAKCSINNLDAAAAMMKLTHMEYQVGNGFFLKTLIAKKYALPTQVINAIIQFFLKFVDVEGGDIEDMESDDEGAASAATGDTASEKRMPVMWHQTLLTLVQCYRPYLSPANCLKIKALIKIHNHPAITPEIRKCLAADYLDRARS